MTAKLIKIFHTVHKDGYDFGPFDDVMEANKLAVSLGGDAKLGYIVKPEFAKEWLANKAL